MNIILYCPKCKTCELNSSMEGYLFLISELLDRYGIEHKVYFNKSNQSLFIHYFKMLKEMLIGGAIVICISQEFILPFFPKRQIVFFHDLIQLSYPRKKIVYLYYKYYLLNIARCVLGNITTAVSTQEKLKHKKINSDVVYRLHSKKDLTITFHSKKEYFAVYVGTNAKHKNLNIFISAANHFKDKKFIVIVPEYVYRQISKHEAPNIIFFRNLSLERYNEVLQQTEFFVSPSYEEGYGPVWDGLRNGCKCILSDIEVYRELFEEVAHFFDPNNLEQLINLMANDKFKFNELYFNNLKSIKYSIKLSEEKFIKLINNKIKNQQKRIM